MIFRYARHTTNLARIEKFYTEIIGLNKLGGFQNHDGYDGLFLGLPDQDWHLEFTVSTEVPQGRPDEDDLLVFYFNTEIELLAIRKKLAYHHIKIEQARNLYWSKSGITVADPDGHSVVFSYKQASLDADDELTGLLKSRSIMNWSDLVEFTRQLPYGRNQNREDFSLVVKELKGTCSSKHAFLKKVADLNKIKHVQLVLGMYKMSQLNTPKIGSAIKDAGLDYIPEAHCYLKLNGKRFDITTASADIEDLSADILTEIEIEPEQVNTFKVVYHRDYLKKWIAENNPGRSLDEIWTIRENCIRRLSVV